MTWFELIKDLDGWELLNNIAPLLIAFLIVLPIGLDREDKDGIGSRTFPLVSMGAAGFMIVGQHLDITADAGRARLLAGLITGVGFLGGGAIVKSGNNVYGTATAASIWAAAVIGGAVAYGRLEVAIALAIATYATLRGVRQLQRKSDSVDVSDRSQKHDN